MKVILSKEQKANIVAQKRLTDWSSYKLSEHFGICDRTIRKFLIKAKNKMINHGRDGRPLALDDDSQLSIKDWLLDLVRNGATLQNEVLQEKIKANAYETYMRRYPNLAGNDKRRKNFLCYSSMKKYEKEFRLFYNNLL